MEYERVYAEEAKRRQVASGEVYGRGKVKANLPEPIGKQASDEAAEMFQVGGRSVRDAKFVAEHDPEAFEQVRVGASRGVRSWLLGASVAELL